jgi:hypothetical protein
MTDPISEAFARLEEWQRKDVRRTWILQSPDWDYDTEDFCVTLRPAYKLFGSGPTIPAAVDAALKQWEKDNG